MDKFLFAQIQTTPNDRLNDIACDFFSNDGNMSFCIRAKLFSHFCSATIWRHQALTCFNTPTSSGWRRCVECGGKQMMCILLFFSWSRLSSCVKRAHRKWEAYLLLTVFFQISYRFNRNWSTGGIGKFFIIWDDGVWFCTAACKLFFVPVRIEISIHLNSIYFQILFQSFVYRPFNKTGSDLQIHVDIVHFY